MISSVVDKTDSLKLTYSITGAPAGTSVKWKFDDGIESLNASAVQSFVFPGKHLAEAVVSNSNGYFRKLGSYNNVSPTKFNKGQVAIFQFYGSKNAPEKIRAVVDYKIITLEKSKQNPDLFYAEVAGSTSGVKNILIHYFQYDGKFSLNILPAISNPDDYINSKINDILDGVNANNSINPSAIAVNASVSALLNELKSKIDNLSAPDRLQLAKFLQANLENSSNLVVKSRGQNYKISRFLDLFISEARADFLSFLLDLSGLTSLQKFASSIPPFDYAVGTLGVVGVAASALCKPIFCKIGIALIIAGTVYKLQAAELDELDKIGDAHLPRSNTLFGQVIGQSLANQTTNIRLRGTFIPVDSLPLNQSSLVLKAINKVKNDNASIMTANNYIDSFNSSLSFFGLTSPVEKIQAISFPQTTVPGFLSPGYITSATLVSPLDGSASAQLSSTTGDTVGVIVNSNKSQTVKVKLVYANNDFGIHQDIIVDIPVLAKPKAIINYYRDNLDFEFYAGDPNKPRPTSLTYLWDFGDGQSATTQDALHSYSSPGFYKVTLTVTGPYGGSSTTRST